MKNYFIIHGTFGHSKENWFSWLENELKEKIKNIGEDEILILDIEKTQYENVENSHQIGDFLVIAK